MGFCYLKKNITVPPHLWALKTKKSAFDVNVFNISYILIHGRWRIRKCNSDSFYFAHIIYINFQPLNPFLSHSWALKDRNAVFLREIMWIFLNNLPDIASLRIRFSLHLWVLKNKKGECWSTQPFPPHSLALKDTKRFFLQKSFDFFYIIYVESWSAQPLPPHSWALKDTKRLSFTGILQLFLHNLLGKLAYTTVLPRLWALKERKRSHSPKRICLDWAKKS